jgi:YggT family protein
MLTWFSNVPSGGKITGILARVTDPYLNWWRQKFPLRAGILDLSPLAGIAAISVAQTICTEIARRGRISLGIILAVLLSAVWSVVSFILVFCIIVLVLRLIGYFCNANIYTSPFWRIVNAVSQPLLYRVNRIVFGKRLVGYKTGIISAVIVFAALWIGGRFVMGMLTGFLSGM